MTNEQTVMRHSRHHLAASVAYVITYAHVRVNQLMTCLLFGQLVNK